MEDKYSMIPIWIKLTLCLTLLGLIGIYGNGWNITKLNVASTVILQMDNKAKLRSSQPCTFSLFRKHNNECNYLPTGGKWSICFDGNQNSTCYQPRICKYKYPRPSENYTNQCLINANVSTIMTIGDSNALRYFKAIMNMMNSWKSCKIISRENLKEGGFLPDEDYLKKYAGDLKQYLNVHFRFCSGCAGMKAKCDLPQKQSADETRRLFIEHIPMTMLFDDSVQFLPPNHHIVQSNLEKMWAINWQEFFLRYLLKDRYPDILIIFPPFVHMKFMKLDRLQVEMEYFRAIVEYYVPLTTKIVYVPVFGEYERARPSKAADYVNKTYENMLATEKLDHMNHIMFSVLKNDLINSSHRTYSFLDLLNVSQSQASWSTDGVHVKPIWYETVISMFWETFCNSVFHNNF